MLSPAETNILAAFKRELISRFGNRLRGLVLFGSRAHGVGRDDSDLDVLVTVEPLSREERGEILDLAADLTLEHDLVLSPLALSFDGTERQKCAGSIDADIQREGIAL